MSGLSSRFSVRSLVGECYAAIRPRRLLYCFMFAFLAACFNAGGLLLSTTAAAAQHPAHLLPQLQSSTRAWQRIRDTEVALAAL